MSSIGRLIEVYPREPSLPMPLGLCVDQSVVGLRIGAADGDGRHAVGLEAQTRSAFRSMRELVERAGGGLENIARVTGYVRSAEEREPVNGPWWEEIFPDPMNRPAYKVLVAPLTDGRAIEFDVIALLGATRRRIDLPGVPARDPTVVIGGMVFTSRVHGTVPFTDDVPAGGVAAQARQAFDNVLSLLSFAGGTARNIVQLTTFGRSPSYVEPTRRVFADVFPDNAARPQLNTLMNFVPAKFDVMVEMVAALEAKD